MIEVYHLNDELFVKNQQENPNSIDKRWFDVNMGFKPEEQVAAATELFNEGFYVQVAMVNTNSLSEAWGKTNHIDDSWLKNKDVQPIVDGARSSRVGDIMKDDDGNYHVVASIGFTKLPEGAINVVKKKIHP